MLFNSITFFVFLLVVFSFYWFVLKNNLKYQNILLLVASYYFYSFWDFRFLFLLIFSTSLDYFTGIKISQAQNKKYINFWFWLSIIINVGFLGVFKYYNFFVDSFAQALLIFGIKVNVLLLSVILPVGISFYTFHGLSYVIDVYNRKIQPVKNFIDYSLFVSFFPLLVAGPIERATHLLPQIQRERRFDYHKAVDGCRQILWGLFKKMVIADNCGEYANQIFNNYSDYSGSTLLLGAVFFTFQIYGDFSGYSDIALGTARLFGIELLQNFSFPYFSRSIAEFWRRWHISLSSWFRDYLYIPLGGSRGNTRDKIKNIFIIFLVSGFWHGANWTFIAWGGLNALLVLPSVFFDSNKTSSSIVASGKFFPSMVDVIRISMTFITVIFLWIFFRANTIKDAILYITSIFTSSLFKIPEIRPFFIFVLLLFFMLIEWLGRENKYGIEKIGYKKSRVYRWSFYFFIIFLIGMFMQTKETTFIYFQF